MVKAIMHGCNGKMGQMITGLVAADEEIEIVAGVDAFGEGKNDYPVFKSLDACDVAADVIIDFSNSSAVDGLLAYCVEKKIPCVLCTTGLSKEQIEKIVVAYEPIWAIGTGKVATKNDANNMIKLIRKEIESLYDKEVANNVSILYGGSVNKNNAKELFETSDIDGALVGGASLKVDEFNEIIKSI